MPEFVPETVTEATSLRSDESFDVEFRPKNPGPVSIAVDVSWDRLIPPDPTKRRLELFVPGHDEPIATDESRGFFSRSSLTDSVTEEDLTTPGQWIARVVNIERMKDTEEFELTVSYPSDTEIQTAELDAFDLEKRLFELFKQSSVTLTSGADHSVVRLRPGISVEDYRFTVPGLDEEVSQGTDHWTVRERLHDLTAEAARITLDDGGTIQLLFEFQQTSYDLVGDLEVRIHHPQIHVAFPIATTEDSVVTGGPTATFDFDIDVPGDPPTPVQWTVDDYAEAVRSQVEEELARAFDRSRVHEYVDEILATEIEPVLPDDASLYGIGRVVQGNLEVKYISE